MGLMAKRDGTSVPSGTYRSTVATETLRSNDRILKKALELFSEKGYDATSVREICEAAGITKPTLYHFYGSKEGVYRAIVDSALERFRADLVLALGGEGSLRDRLVRMAQAYVEDTQRSPDLARFSMACTAVQSSVELRNSARTPASCKAATWSCISAISGEITMPVPGRSSDGIW